MSPSPGSSDLVRAFVELIRERGPISFAAFMERALHDPDHGYYAAGGRRIGRAGDFFTASDVGELFGGCVARQIVEMDEILGRPDPFHVVEFGAGRGLLAADVTSWIERNRPALASRLVYVAVDRSAEMRREAAAAAPRIVVETPDEAVRQGPGRTGCVLAVELFDALPVHRVRRRHGALVEIRVGVREEDDGPVLVEVEAEPTPELAAEADRRGAAATEGFEAEVCLELAPCLSGLAGALRSGYLVAVDYGYGSRELYGPAHARGTLLAYHRHTTSEDVLVRVGEQDLTAHVDLDALAAAASSAGWTPVGRTTQDRFLIANGILEAFEDDAPGSWSRRSRVHGRMRAMQLIHPNGMGRTFHVLVFRRGHDAGPHLRGLMDPFAR